ncbi:MAG: HAMP domain-containing protein [Firmicutes bacterium]|nr:HAMP domain-containing protein [Bacillota bacterium]MBR3212039.1 HAMP domain-containing protein [Bacillota bacterium]
MNTKIKFNLSSIRSRLWAYFILFAVIIVVLIWALQILFLDQYYEDMKLKEADQLAKVLVQEYQQSDSLLAFAERLNDVSSGSDSYIRVETGDGRVLLTPEYNGYSQMSLYNTQTAYLRFKLQTSEASSYSEITPSSNNTRILSYACYLYQSTDSDIPEINNAKSSILYMYTPLYPVRSTVEILRKQLVYITVIALLLAFSMAFYMSTRISKPIKDITQSAAEMGRGNYGVQFKGGKYSEIRELAETLTDASRELEKSDMYQKDLMANVSHDLKTPLTMIRSYAEMIRDLSGDIPEKREQHLSVIIDEADRLNRLVDDMLTISRMQQKNIVLERADFDIVETARSLLDSYDILAEQEGYEFIFDGEDEPVFVNGDKAKIKQVFSNLINNAVKYCGEDKVIIVSVKRDGKKVRCEVTDHGEGIAPDEINHVWERYYKSSTHHVRPTSGSGLGLSIVREILTLHKAEYGVDSELGEGSTFWFELEQVKKNR